MQVRKQQLEPDMEQWTVSKLGKVCQKYANLELPDVKSGFRKGRGTRDQIANIHWIT